MIVGIDFGTSNSACSVRLDSGDIRPVILQPGSLSPYLLPSYWYFPEGSMVPVVGQKAKEMFVESGHEGRFILSLKSHLSNTELKVVTIHGKAISLEMIVSFILKKIRISVEEQFGKITSVYAGRPVVLSEDCSIDQKIEDRLREAYRLAGYPDPVFVPEPVAAAYAYKQHLRKAETVFICDFGGGTLDYCLAMLESKDSSKGDVILGTKGIRIGGDDLTGSLMRLFWDFFGYSSQVKDFTREKWLPFPVSIFSMLSNWKNIWRLQGMARKIKGYIHWGSSDPDALNRLIALIEPENYFEFLNELERTKILLSSQKEVSFSFQNKPIEITRVITRMEFESVTANLLRQAEEEIFDVFEGTNTTPKDVKTVFLTGGSSQIPAFQKIVEKNFGKEGIQKGEIFTSVANGLAAYQSS